MLSASTDDDYGYVSFDVIASRDELRVHVHFCEDIELFEHFGEKLMAFPQSPDDVVELEIGRIRSGFQGYLLLRAYCYTPNCHAALKVVVHNNADEPQAQRVEFSIPAEVASLNKLGNLLKNWQPSVKPVIDWQSQVS